MDINKVVDETQKGIISIIEASGLPISVIKLILRSVYSDVENTERALMAQAEQPQEEDIKDGNTTD